MHLAISLTSDIMVKMYGLAALSDRAPEADRLLPLRVALAQYLCQRGEPWRCHRGHEYACERNDIDSDVKQLCNVFIDHRCPGSPKVTGLTGQITPVRSAD